MKKTLLLLTLCLFSSFSIFAQNPTQIQCTMTLEQIGMAQPYDIDHPDQEETYSIASSLISELSIIYDLVAQNNSTDLDPHLELIQSSVNAAISLGMNYSMFQADLDYIETLN